MLPFLQRFNWRSPAFLAVLAVTLLYLAAGGLDWRWAAAGAAAVAVWTVFRSDDPSGNGGSQSTVGAHPDWRATQRLTSLPLTALDAIPDAAVLLDGRGFILAANTAARGISAVLIGKPYSHWLRAPELLAAIEKAMRSGAQQSCHLRLFSPVERSLSALVTPISNGDAAGLLVVLRDLTDQEMVSRLRADFVANASHELRTPLASIRGFVETLQGAAKDDPAAQARFLAIMQSQAERMSRLIEDLLSLSRIEMHEHVAPTARTDLAAVAHDAIAALKLAAGQADITIRADIPAEAMDVTGDKDELAQVAQNLIQNAIKYGQRGGHVDVKVRRDGANVELAISDDGIGIAPEHLPRLTERFYRVSAKNSKERGGTGLGLAIVKHIVNRHGGELKIISTPEKGSTFSIFIPASAAQD